MQSTEQETSSSPSWLLRTHFSRSVCHRPAETSLTISSSNRLSADENYLSTSGADRTHPSSTGVAARAGSRRRAAAIFHIEPLATTSSSDHLPSQESLFQRESPFASLPPSPSPPAAAPAIGSSDFIDRARLVSPSAATSSSASRHLSRSSSNNNMASSTATGGAAPRAASMQLGTPSASTAAPNSKLSLRAMFKSLSHPPSRSSSYSSFLLNENQRHYGGASDQSPSSSSQLLITTTPPETSPRVRADAPADRSPLQRSSKIFNKINPEAIMSTPMKPSASMDSCMNAEGNAKSRAGGHRRSPRVADADPALTSAAGGGGNLLHVASPAHHRLFRSRRNAIDGADVAARMRSTCSEKWLDDLSLLLLGERFASGSYSRLYHGIYRDSPVAVKIIRQPDDDDVLAHRIEHLFFQEVTVLSCLDHDNIIKLLAACKKPPVLCVITEYLPGGSLRAFLSKRWPPPPHDDDSRMQPQPQLLLPEKVVAMAMDVARGMEYLHSKGIVHRDLKSENLVLSEDGRLKIVDFGVSCFEWEIRGAGGVRQQHDDGGDDVGTYRWMAPEMLSHKPHSRKVDVYSFGIVLWELLTMRLPYEGMSPVQAAFSVVHQNRRPPIPTDCPSSLAHLLRRCWSAQPDARPEFREITKMLSDYDMARQRTAAAAAAAAAAGATG